MSRKAGRPTRRWPAYDLAKAKELMKEAGYERASR